MNLDEYSCFGRYPKVLPKNVVFAEWRHKLPNFSKIDTPVLAHAYGKSYGDSCLLENGTLIDTRRMNHFIDFDRENATITCEAGVTLAKILDLITPERFFLAATPGTKHISVGGAIANDVHGKNHHVAGTFGTNLIEFELVRSTGERLICSRTENPELFAATIGGLGLTGLITWAKFNIRKVSSPFIRAQSILFDSLEGFFEINEESERDYNYTVSWVDLTARDSRLGRGIYNRGNHLNPEEFEEPKLKLDAPIPNFPLDYPFINALSVQAFNTAYYNKQMTKKVEMTSHFNPFFYPLDAVGGWNKAYGKNGFLQYQFVIPFDNVYPNIRKILKFIVDTGLSSFMTVLKTFGSVKSPGMLSFPRPGVTLAVDFRYEGTSTLEILKKMNVMVRDFGGVIYPAKDAQMSVEDFHAFYPQAEEFAKYIDPKFDSHFRQRVKI